MRPDVNWWAILGAAIGGVFLALLWGVPLMWFVLANEVAIKEFVSESLGTLRAIWASFVTTMGLQ